MINESTRLALQYLEDAGGESHGGPMDLYDALRAAIKTGLVREILPPGGSGCIAYRLTKAGGAALDAANVALGNDATRYAYVKVLRGRLDEVFGWPQLVSGNQLVRFRDGQTPVLKNAQAVP